MLLQTSAVRRFEQENELLQRFVRTNLQELDPVDVKETSKKSERRSLPKIEVQPPQSQPPEKHKHQPGATEEPSSAKSDSKRVNIELARGKNKKKRNKQDRDNRHEEVYTDKDRAAAVNMGNKDIKQSLKLKRKQDRSKNLLLPEEADPSTFLALGNYEMSRGDLDIALNFIDKALELNPVEKNALVARSKCYILLGQPENGLRDAETALSIDKNFIKAIYQKAESLYYLGDFEHSLMYHHRGLRLRPEHEGFKLGVHKAQKAIENAIGSSFPSASTLSNLSSPTKDLAKPSTPSTAKMSSNRTSPDDKISSKSTTNRMSTATTKQNQRNTPASVKSAKKSRLLRELAPDKEYLDKLMTNPDLKCKIKEDDTELRKYIQDAVDFLNTRQEFWRQQMPPNCNNK